MTDTIQPTTVADVKPGDFFQHNGVSPEPVEALSVHPYIVNDAGRVLVVHLDPTGNTPQAARLWADDEVHVATEAEVAAVKAAQRRAEFINGVHDFANWLEANPELPQPRRAVFQYSMVNGDDAEKIATVRAAAEHLGITEEIFDVNGDPTIRVYPLPGFEYVIHGFIAHLDDATTWPGGTFPVQA